jgi:hypothetical protein
MKTKFPTASLIMPLLLCFFIIPRHLLEPGLPCCKDRRCFRKLDHYNLNLIKYDDVTEKYYYEKNAFDSLCRPLDIEFETLLYH